MGSHELELIVTPMHKERQNVSALHDNLRARSTLAYRWVIADDRSTHGTRAELGSLQSEPRSTLLDHTNAGGLVAGRAYRAWRHGVETTLAGQNRKFTRVMKLDADVALPPKHLAVALSAVNDTVGLVGGVLGGPRQREQALHAPGPIKLYLNGIILAIADTSRVDRVRRA